MGKKVRTAVVAAAATGALLFGGGVAAAAPASVPATPVTPAKPTNPFVDKAKDRTEGFMNAGEAWGGFTIKYSKFVTCKVFLPKGACK